MVQVKMTSALARSGGARVPSLPVHVSRVTLACEASFAADRLAGGIAGRGSAARWAAAARQLPWEYCKKRAFVMCCARARDNYSG
jgi:hypothetical protein